MNTPEDREDLELNRYFNSVKTRPRLTKMCRFVLSRDKDVMGVSGTGIIAEGVVFGNGKVALCWRTQYKSVGIYDSIEDVEHIHCHDANTQIGWIDLHPDA